ncbi:ABC transporter substrate-binding protein [Streptomyces shenzhenensis]|uniref:ABC transporter substrate-binding protein n=1 Tax=Streptomyces shenzhenensis TaxID=943815 RepID=UPI0033EAF091
MILRRSTLRAIPAVALAALLPAVLTACAGAATDKATPAAKDITVAVPAISPPFNASNQANINLRITSNIFDPLIFRDPKTNKLSPGLATKWTKVSPTVTDITIRSGVKFQDGTPMTAQDVAFTLSAERLWGPDALEPTTLANTFSDVKVKDEDTVEITTSRPDPTVLDRLASPIGFVVPKAYLLKVGEEKFGVHPIGTGPYKVQSIKPGQSADLTANKDYWGPEPTYEKVTFDQVADVTARVSGLATGQYSIATSIPPDQRDRVKGNGQRIVSTQVDNMVGLAFTTNQPGEATSDPLVRQAMELAIDRKSIADSLWNGQVSVHDGFNLPVYKDFYDSTVPVTGQDLAKAKSLLSKAGYDGRQIVLQYITGYYTNLDQALQAMLPMWKQAGLNVKLDPVANYTLLDYDKLQVYPTSSNILLSDPVSPICLDWVCPSANYVKSGRFRPSAQMASAADTLSTGTSQPERKKAFDTITKLWTTEVPSISLWQPVEINGLADGVDFTPDPRYWMRFAPVPES